MKTRDDALVYQETQSSDKTSKTWDLKYTDPLSALFLEFDCVNGTTSNKDNFISDIITKIEIVDGGKPLYELPMDLLEALHFYKTKRMPPIFPSAFPSGNNRHGVMMMFGRKLWDSDFAFNHQSYKNPQLKISWDLGAVRTIDTTTSFATGTLKISAIAKIMEGVGAPPNFLSAREVETFTMPTSGSKKVEMWTDFPWRLLMLKSFLQGKDIDECISYLTLNCDSGKFKPLDNRYVHQLDHEALALFGAGRIKHDIFAKHQTEFRLVFNKEPSVDAYSWEDSSPNIIGVRYAWSSGCKLDITDNAGTAVTADASYTTVEIGHAPHATLAIPFGDMDKPEQWFNAKEYAGIDLFLYAPSTGAAGVSSVVLEQVRPNGE